MDEDTELILGETVSGATTGGLVGAASSIVTGVAVAKTPVELLGLITLGTTTAISWPVVLAVGAGGAVVGGVAAAMSEARRQGDLEDDFDNLLGDGD